MHPNRNDYKSNFAIYSIRDKDGAVVAVGQTTNIKKRRSFRQWRHGDGFTLRVETVLPSSTRGEAKRVERNLQDHFDVPDEQRSKSWRKVISEKASKRSGIDGSVTKFVYIGTNRDTGETIELIGAKAIEKAGFQYPCLRLCSSGIRSHHKGYTWERHLIGENWRKSDEL